MTNPSELFNLYASISSEEFGNLIWTGFAAFRKIGNTDTISVGEYTICGWGGVYHEKNHRVTFIAGTDWSGILSGVESA